MQMYFNYGISSDAILVPIRISEIVVPRQPTSRSKPGICGYGPDQRRQPRLFHLGLFVLTTYLHT